MRFSPARPLILANALLLFACGPGYVLPSQQRGGPGPFKQAIQLNGTSSFAALAGLATIVTTGVTIEFFFQTTSTTAPFLASFIPVGVFDITMNANGTITAQSPNGSPCTAVTTATTTGSYNDGKVHYLAVSHSAAGTSGLYVDGSLSSLPHTAWTSCTFSNIWIGANNGASPFLAGLVDEFRLSTNFRYSVIPSLPSAPFANDANTNVLLHFDTAGGDILGSGSLSYNQTPLVTSPVGH